MKMNLLRQLLASAGFSVGLMVLAAPAQEFGMPGRRAGGFDQLLPRAAAGNVARGQGVRSAPPGARRMRGAGSWKTEGRARRAAQRWDLDVTRGEDDSIRGRITLGDSPLARLGNVSGRIEGDRVVGTITTDRGKQVARFKGTITPAGIRGTYRDGSGEMGSWAWDGQLPR